MPKGRPKSNPPARKGTREVLELVPRRVESARLDGIVIGTVTSVDAAGVVSVSFPQNRSGAAVIARSTVVVRSCDLGREAALLFEGDDWRRPIVIGLITRPSGGTDERSRSVELDGDRVLFTADKEIVLRCGNATITLTRAGKILIRGAYLLSRSSGVNRIKGGSIQLN